MTPSTKLALACVLGILVVSTGTVVGWPHDIAGDDDQPGFQLGDLDDDHWSKQEAEHAQEEGHLETCTVHFENGTNRTYDDVGRCYEVAENHGLLNDTTEERD